MGEWESGRVGEWESGRVAEWQSGRVGEWEEAGGVARRKNETIFACSVLVPKTGLVR